MKPTIGFILLTHNKPYQVIRLVSVLNHMFDNPSIVCHHDFSQSNFDGDTLTGNVSIVQPHIKTGWGRFSIIEAMLRAFQLMVESPASPDWFILLSGADYPIKPAGQIISDLDSSLFDVHIEHEPIRYSSYKSDWHKMCYYRYCVVKFWVPFLNWRHHLIRRIVTLSNPLITSPFLPFSRKFGCFAGGQWFCANRKAANYLMKFHKEKPALAAHYRRLDRYKAIVPEESYFQTIFGNAPGLKVSENNWRYTDWSTQGSHPKTLLDDDLPKILASSAHFARKFDLDEDVRIFNEFDSIIG